MKKILILFMFCLVSQLRSDAQVIISLLFGDKLNNDKLFFGLHVNYTGSQLTNLEGAENLGAFKLALLFNYRFSDRFRLQSELLPPMWFGTKGLPPYSLGDAELDDQFKDGEVERRIWLTGMTALAQYRVYDYIYAEAGPEIFLRTKARDIFTAESETGDLSLERDVKDQTAAFEFGFALGASYHLQKGTGMMLGFRYYWGLTDVMKNDPDSQQFRMWQVTSGIPIGRKKGLEKAKAAEKTGE